MALELFAALATGSIDRRLYRGQQLVGCLSCNVWWSRWSANSVKLSEEDLHALHELRRAKDDG